MKIIRIFLGLLFCVVFMCSCKSTRDIMPDTLNEDGCISSVTTNMTNISVSEANETVSDVTDTTRDSKTLLCEQDVAYIQQYGNPDPTINGNKVLYELTNNKIHFSFRESFSFSPYAHMHVSCFYTNHIVLNPMIYRFPSVEWKNENGKWIRLSYLPSDIDAIEDRWIPLVNVDGSITDIYDNLAVSIEDIMNPPIGSYRIILYIYGETKEDNDIYLKYEIPFDVNALTAYPKEA